MVLTDDRLRFRQVISCLSPVLQKALSNYTDRFAGKAVELRLRVDRPFSVVCPDKTFYIGKTGVTEDIFEVSNLTVSKRDISETFQSICNYSVYAKQNEIVNGFVTLRGGHRAGICGTAVNGSNAITNIRDISSINIRIAREHTGCADNLLQRLGSINCGVMICGVPCSGKTTVLRDLARSLSYKHKISLIDERGELAGTVSGVYQNDIGMCDIFDGYKKSDAMLMSLRAMSPEIIVCDEIGSAEDKYAVEQCLNSGVKIISTVHCADERELKRRRGLKELIGSGAFSKIVFLSGRDSPGKIEKIVNVGDILGN